MKTKIITRPWGNFETFTQNTNSTIKILTINPKKRLSLQYHNNREEFWRVLEGNAKITQGKKTISAKKGDTIFINKKQIHRIEAFNKQVKILEIAFGKFNENDIIRIEDDYGRIKK